MHYKLNGFIAMFLIVSKIYLFYFELTLIIKIYLFLELLLDLSTTNSKPPIKYTHIADS